MVGACPPELLPSALELMNEEFILSRGRLPRLETRFPGVYTAENILVAIENGEVVAALAAPLRKWREASGQTWIALIGGVCTARHARKRGVMTQLLRHSEDCLKTRGASAMILWAKNQSYYGHRGWRAIDPALIATCRRPARAVDAYPFTLRPLDDESVDAINALRSPIGLSRSRKTFRTMPVPAIERRTWGAWDDDRLIAYLVAGMDAERGYVYEIEGDETAFTALLNQLSSLREDLLLNCLEGDRFHSWTKGDESVSWRKRNTAMGRILDDAFSWEDLARITIGYLDVI